MREEERIMKGILFSPSDQELKTIKRRAHNLSQRYSQTFEEQTEERDQILQQLLGQIGKGGFLQGPIFFHYGVHTRIGDHFFGNYNLTIQDDAQVTIGDYTSFGPNVTIVTPIHPMIASERRQMVDQNGDVKSLCYAKPVTIGNDVWISANVTVCGGVTIGNGCVIGAGSVVTRDIPPHSFAAGVPCKVIRKITDADSMRNYPDVLADCRVLEE
ncbi:sugar O-acetyltransferase [Paenibacillus sp. CFBP 13594]|uniref:sugar O-acetyltransferase n=1 Tax=Paenibacillus sp. CFBP 13594 TaxID=2774037 RepID=UPI00177E6C4E|nr:sugar O-acetyltransferase [Paenibacillus sp. CFBP 13594]MBD8839170.1 sugar O-acetyltransferase [Paenibacillus sp. CFBP 13594]